MLTLLVAVAAHAQCAPAGCAPTDLADDPNYREYAKQLEDLTAPLNPSFQLWEGTVSIRSTEGRQLGEVMTMGVGNGVFVERWVWFDDASHEITTDEGFDLAFISSSTHWDALVDGYMDDPLWADYGYVEQQIKYQVPPTQADVNGMVVFNSPHIELTNYEMYQPGTAAPVGYLMRERRIVGGEIEWHDHWMFDGWTLIGLNGVTAGSVEVAPVQFTSVKGWMNHMVGKSPSHYARSVYTLGTLGEDAP